MELRTNCKNCGAPLEYSKNDYGKSCRCKYCRQEYHIDLLGRVEEYKVKLEVMGKVIDFYINSITVEPDTIECFTVDDYRQSTAIINNSNNIILELIGRT